MTTLRVVFDTNTFSLEHFDALDSSSMRLLCKRGQISPIYGDVFLEEMMQAYISPRARTDLIHRWLPFISETANRLCRELPLVWHDELVQGRGLHASIFMSQKNQSNVLSEFATLPLDGSWSLIEETQDQREKMVAKKLAQRNLSKAMREEVSRKMKAQKGQPTPASGDRLATSRRDDMMEFIGRTVIERHMDTRNPRAIASRWMQNRANYPYFTQFALNMAYKEAHFMTQHNAPIDVNAQADLDIMTHLLRGDALVTNEKGFMRTAFDDLWRPKKKVVFTSTEFVKFLQKL